MLEVEAMATEGEEPQGQLQVEPADEDEQRWSENATDIMVNKFTESFFFFAFFVFVFFGVVSSTPHRCYCEQNVS